MIELRECPFCGGEAKIERWDSEKSYARCVKCNIYTAPYVKKEHAEETWNRRPDMWIPVSERLPKVAGEYMVVYHPCYWDQVRDEICVGIDTFRGKTAWAKNKYQRVTHWMPLPEPPEKGE